MDIFAFAQAAGKVLDLIGVLIILAGVSLSIGSSLRQFFNKVDPAKIYNTLRQNLGRSILLGLEILIAGDIIRSISGTPDFRGIGVLALIVIIRSFLGITFEMEIEGRWPWNRHKAK